MAGCMYIAPQMAPWYACYVLLFNMLVGPVFSAGTVTSERERETLELLLTTTLSPWQILWGKLFSGLRISMVLTSFLVWPLLLACLLPPWTYWADMPTMFGYVAIIAVSSLTTTVAGDVLLGDLPQDDGEHDDHLRGDPAAVRGAAGGRVVRAAVVSRVAGDGLDSPT